MDGWSSNMQLETLQHCVPDFLRANDSKRDMLHSPEMKTVDQVYQQCGIPFAQSPFHFDSHASTGCALQVTGTKTFIMIAISTLPVFFKYILGYEKVLQYDSFVSLHLIKVFFQTTYNNSTSY